MLYIHKNIFFIYAVLAQKKPHVYRNAHIYAASSKYAVISGIHISIEKA